MADKCTTLQRTFTSTQALRDASSQVQSSNDSFSDHLTTELTAKESDIATFLEGLPSASTSLRGLETVKNATTASQVALLAIDQCVPAIEEEWEIPKELSRHMSHSPGVFSTTRNNVQKNIVAKTQDILPPICR